MILGCITNQILWADIIQNFAFSSFCLEIRIRHGGILWEKDKTVVYSATGLSLAFLTLILLLVKVCVEVLTAQVHSRPTNHYYDYFSNKMYCFIKKKHIFTNVCLYPCGIRSTLQQQGPIRLVLLVEWTFLNKCHGCQPFYVFCSSRLELTNRENKTADFEYILLSSYRDWLIPWQPSLKKTSWCSVCPLKTLCSSYGCFVYQAVCFLVTDKNY